MSAILPIDTTLHDWRLVKLYCEARIEELTEQCIATGSTDLQRLVAAHRIEELRELIGAPQRAKAATEHRRTNTPMGVY